MPLFNTKEEINRYIMKQAELVMKEAVAPVIKQKVSDKVETEVYDAYSTKNSNKKPYVYERRGASEGTGGIGDTSIMETNFDRFGNTINLKIVNMAKGQDDSMFIADLIEGGQGTNGKEYKYTSTRETKDPSYLKARPFQQEAANELDQTKEHITEFLKGMRDLGIDIRKM